MNIEKIISGIEDADEVEIMEYDFDECFRALRFMHATLVDVIAAHELSSVDWAAMKDAKKIISID